MSDRRFARASLLPGSFLVFLVVVTQAAFATPPITFGTNLQLGGADPQGFRQSDPSVAVNPNDPNNIVVTYREVSPVSALALSVVCRFATSFDGGATWQVGAALPLQKKESTCDQPSVAADSQGNFYLAYKDLYYLGPYSAGVVDMLVAKSTNGGLTFPTYSLAVRHGSNSPRIQNQLYPVKGYLGVDNSPRSPYQGTIYLGFTSENAVPDARVMVVDSHDGGSTWSDPVLADSPLGINVDEIYQDNALPVVAADGSAYLFFSEWNAEDSIAGPLKIRLAKSTDGGVTWQAQSDVATNLVSPGKFRLKNAEIGWPSAAGTAGVFGTSYPTVAITPNGSFYVAWTDFPNGSCIFPGKCQNADVRLTVSNDGGLNWSTPVKVSDDTGATDQFNPWLAAHLDGTVSLSWADKRLDPNNINYDVFYTETTDGVKFLHNVRVTSASSLVGTQRYVGEYSGMVATTNGDLPVWTDLRFGGSDWNIFVAPGRSKP